MIHARAVILILLFLLQKRSVRLPVRLGRTTAEESFGDKEYLEENRNHEKVIINREC
jgi:hypothetical protein